MIEKEYYELYVDEPEEYEVEFVEAKIKPETIGHATPTEEVQTVTPAPGTTFSAVDVDAIPPEYIKPTGTVNIAENGETDVREYASALVAVPQPSGKITIIENGTGLDIADYAEADIDVQPNLQTHDPITPTKSQQTITPSAGYDGLANAVVEPIPSEYIVPAGKITLTENATDVDVRQYAAADIAVPIPVDYFSALLDKSISGDIIDTKTKQISGWMFTGCIYITGIIFTACEVLGYSETYSATVDSKRLFYRCEGTKKIILPALTQTILPRSFNFGLQNFIFNDCPACKLLLLGGYGGNDRIEGSSFQNLTSLKSMVFTFAPVLSNTNAFNNSTTATFYFPDNAVDAMKSATNWSAFTSRIKGFSDVDSYDVETTYTIGDLCKIDGKLYAWINNTDGNSIPSLTVNNFNGDWFCVADL